MARGVLANWASLIVRAGLALAIIPVIISQFGTEMYGVIILVTILVGLSRLADFGFGQAVSRELAECQARGDTETGGIITSTALFVYCVLATILGALVLLFNEPLLAALGVNPLQMEVAVCLVKGYAIPSLVMSLLLPPFAAHLASINRFDVLKTIELAGTLLNGAGLLLLLPNMEDKVFAWVAVTVCCQGVTFFGTIACARKFCGPLGIGPRSVRACHFGRIFRLGGGMYVMQLASMLTDKSDPVILSHFRGEGSVSVYHPGAQIPLMLRPLVGSLASQMHPSTTRSHVTGDSGRMKMLLFLGTRYTLLAGIGVCVIGGMFSSGFCSLWLGRTPGMDWQTAAWVMKGCLIADLCQYFGGVQWAVLVGMKRLRVMVSGMLVAAAVNVTATFLLMKHTSLGIAWVTVPTIAVNLVLRPCLALYASRLCGVDFRAYWRNAYARPVKVGILLALACWLLVGVFPTNTLAGLSVAGGLAGVTWMGLIWGIGLTARERELVRNRISGRR